MRDGLDWRSHEGRTSARGTCCRPLATRIRAEGPSAFRGAMTVSGRGPLGGPGLARGAPQGNRVLFACPIRPIPSAAPLPTRGRPRPQHRRQRSPVVRQRRQQRQAVGQQARLDGAVQGRVQPHGGRGVDLQQPHLWGEGWCIGAEGDASSANK